MALLLTFGLAHALSTYPGEVSSHLEMECAPTCQLCHDNPAGGSGTATLPFAVAMQADGLAIAVPDSVAVALDALQARGAAADSDGDGTNDVDQLIIGENPNPDGTDFCPASGDAPPPIQRGCFAEGAALGFGLAVAAARWRRARR
jgi:hypothetical protein